MDVQAETKTHELVIERRFDAPPELLFKMWTEPEHIVRWWGCPMMRANKVTNDLRVGGGFRSEMTLEDGVEHTLFGTYREIEPPTRVSFTWTWENETMGRGYETLVTVMLAADGDGTMMTLRHEFFEDADMRDQHNEGWTASVDRLSGIVAEG
jgi:uncharacterized protein YndB with AHSA1/START domain